SVGDLVRLFTFRQGVAELVEMTLPSTSPVVGHSTSSSDWPQDTVPVAVVRGTYVKTPDASLVLEAGDELLFVAAPEREAELQALLGH
ncbi:MAG: TrkA C-terminal domain-containing protein, partial [Actinomycetota bacterium]|nr:TrkA C-terminal domain-containing protein [Actinomycetota bacterium]